MGLISKLRALRAPRLRRSPDTRSRRADRLRVMLDVARLLETSELHALLLKLGAAAARLLRADRGRIFLHEEDSDELWAVSDDGHGERHGTGSGGPVALAFQTGQVTEAAAKAGPTRLRDAGPGVVKSALLAPLRDLDGRRLGVVEVTRTRRSGWSEEDRLALELFAEHAAVAIQRYRLQQAAAQGHELQRELELAKRVQEALLPSAPPAVPGLECLGWTRQASVTGGDCFDLWRVPDGRLAVFLGDASGHGVAAALVIAQVRAMLRALCEIQTDPLQLLVRVNTRLAQDLGEGRFVTAMFACVSPDGLLRWSSAGQGPLLARTSAREPFQQFQAPAVPLGVASELIADAVPAMRLEPGGMLVAMTDGVFEAADPSGEQLGPARVVELLDRRGDLAPAALLDELQQAVRAWQAEAEPTDDQTIVLVRRK